ncbi:poly-beta-1,6-N-acetyl-D-glucosamine biosynthesis protein PgaD [Acinetobacter pragensis]|uniref:poly-beta-1,6-N-acetyl-D-glucosamine biosynthesis protein PgaD n=1 Tax=Acinetobacter pragensis TaxID=1806892 RepID=UPI003340B7B2
MKQMNNLAQKPDDAEFHVIKDLSLLELPEYIDKPEYVRRKSAGYGLMAIGWVIWMWLFLPVLTLLFWWFEGTVVYTQVVEQTQPMTSISVLKLMVCIGIFISALFIWASYNWVRFHGEDRRQSPENIDDAGLARSFNIQPHEIVQMRQSKNITLHYSEEGQLEDYQINA